MAGFPFLWAVHIADGVLSWPWIVAGFLVSGLLTILASQRVEEKEIPRIALLTAAFFVASSIHVKIGPTSVHLLLAGLVGVILGRRAPLAILLGVSLQALLVAHGGLTMIGVNALVQIIPALTAAILFPLLLQACSSRYLWLRSLVVGVTALVWSAAILFGLTVLICNPWHDLVRVSTQGGVSISIEQLTPALQMMKHPISLSLCALFTLACVVLERRLVTRVEFPAGVFVGVTSVVFTTLLVGLVLVCDGAETWGAFASLIFLAHLPLALIEGLILGVTVGFLARVKPDMLYRTRIGPRREPILLPITSPAETPHPASLPTGQFPH